MAYQVNNREWLTKLVCYDTTSHKSNLKLITEISECFTFYKIPFRLTYDANKQKANLFATLPAHDGAITGGIVLSGHTDVVPVNGQQWDADPFTAIEIEGRIYGRGTCDMKGFIAVVLALIPEFKKLKLTQPVHFAFSYDEEIGCLGAPKLIADFQQQGIYPHACIVGEPTEMRPVTGHKGINVFRCRVQGLAAHSSLTPKGCNSIDDAAQLINHLRNLANELQQNGPFDNYYDVPFTSISSNLIQGGNALNTIPALCEFFFEIRNLPETNLTKFIDQLKIYINENLLPNMINEYPKAMIEIDPIASVPGLEASEQAALTQLIRKLTDENTIRKVSYATEAGLFQQAGISTIVCGPGSIEQAHRANEFVTLEQLDRCENFLKKLVY